MADLGTDGDHQSVFARMMAQRKSAAAPPMSPVVVRPAPTDVQEVQHAKPAVSAYDRRKEMAKSRPRPNDGRYKPKLHGPRDQQLNTTISETSKVQLVAIKNLTRKSIADLVEEMIDKLHQAEFGKRS